MATSKLNAKSPTIRRILREAQELAASPSADLAAAPLESDLFEWHFTIRGPPQTAYADGIYHGRIVLPPTYPLRPPSFRFATPSGRFEANREICLSISGHHEETWQPAWGLRTALVALRAFMESDPKGQVGGLDASDAVRRRLAGESGAYVCAGCGGRSNAAILKESAAAEAELKKEEGDKAAAARAADMEVPPELKLVFRDELGGGAASGSGSPAPTGSATPATPATPAAPGTPIQAAPARPPPAAPAHAVPVPTPTIPLPAAARAPVTTPPRTPPLTIAAGRALPGRAAQVAAQAQAQGLRPRRNSDDAVPLWVDRSIVVLCVVLAAMLLRVVFG